MMMAWINEISVPGDLEELQAIPEDIWQTTKMSTAKFMMLNIKHRVLLVLAFIPKIIFDFYLSYPFVHSIQDTWLRRG